MRRIMNKLRCLVKGHLWEPRKSGHWSRHVCICCGKHGMTHFVPVIAENSARTKCEGYADPEERCPRHPNDCICWQGRNPSHVINRATKAGLEIDDGAAVDAKERKE